MTNEEKFEERLGAIIMHVEILSSMQMANEKAILDLTGTVATLASKVDILTDRTIQAMDAIGRLANIAAAHEQRIENLENRNR